MKFPPRAPVHPISSISQMFCGNTQSSQPGSQPRSRKSSPEGSKRHGGIEDEKKMQRQALIRAQELMKMTELPEGVELHSDVDEDATKH